MTPAKRAPRRAGRDRGDVLTVAGRVIAERGAEATRFSDVSAAAEVPISTLQYYFGNREDMIVAAFRHLSAGEGDRLRAAVAATADSEPWPQLLALLRIGLADEEGDAPHTWRLWVELWRAAMRDEDLRADALELAGTWRRLVATVIERGQTSGVFSREVDAALVAHQAVCLVDGAGIPVALSDPDFPGSGLDMISDAVARLLSADAAANHDSRTGAR